MTLHTLATQLTEAGFSVVPPRPDGTKAPATTWSRFQHRLPIQNELDRWYKKHPNTGIGIVTGQVSGGLEMLEFEGKAVTEGTLDNFYTLIETNGLTDLWNSIETAYTERTPTGGYHFYYRCPTIEGNLKLASTPTHETLIETRGEGGYTIIAPTSGTVHPTGKPWEAIHGNITHIPTITPQQRQALHNICRQLDQTPQPTTTNTTTTSGHTERPGDEYNNHPNAIQTTLNDLTHHGWHHTHTDPDGTHHLTRPGKNPKEGTSATLGSPKTGGMFHVFSSNAHPFEPNTTYNHFAVYTILNHNNDFHAAANALDPPLNITLILPTPTKPPTPDRGITFLNLQEIVTGTFANEKWLVEPILPLGRLTAFYATGKTGKSLLLLDVATKLATGHPILHTPEGTPIHVLYLDFEMTPGDLQERLLKMGYNPNHPHFKTLKHHLHYAQLQPWHAFDTKEGGEQLLNIIGDTQSQLVIIDTFIRSVEGEENSSDTIKNFNRHTGMSIKAGGITAARLDHAGKDLTKGQRGSSAKRDDVDLIWRIQPQPTITPDTEELRLRRDASRIPWVTEYVDIKRRNNPLTHTIDTYQINSHEAEAARRIHATWGPIKTTNLPSQEDVRAIVGKSADAVRGAIRYIERNGWSEGLTRPPEADWTPRKVESDAQSDEKQAPESDSDDGSVR